MSDRQRSATNLDWPLVAAVTILVAIGLVQAYGYGAAVFHGRLPEVVVGIAGLVVCAAVDYRKVVDRSWWLCGGLVVALVFTAGLIPRGNKVWVDPRVYLPVDFVSGLVYVFVAVVFARIYGRAYAGPRPVRDWVVGGGVVALTCAVVGILHAGAAVGSVVVAAVAAMVVAAGLRVRVIAVGALATVVFAAGLWAFVLADYQRQRILMTLVSVLDPAQMEMRVMVGSGGFSGRELQVGRVSDWGDWLPDEFVPALLAREHGFAGVVFTLGLYMFVVMRALSIARAAAHPAGAVLVAGFIMAFAVQVLWSASGLTHVSGLRSAL